MARHRSQGGDDQDALDVADADQEPAAEVPPPVPGEKSCPGLADALRAKFAVVGITSAGSRRAPQGLPLESLLALVVGVVADWQGGKKKTR